MGWTITTRAFSPSAVKLKVSGLVLYGTALAFGVELGCVVTVPAVLVPEETVLAVVVREETVLGVLVPEGTVLPVLVPEKSELTVLVPEETVLAVLASDKTVPTVLVLSVPDLTVYESESEPTLTLSSMALTKRNSSLAISGSSLPVSRQYSDHGHWGIV